MSKKSPRHLSRSLALQAIYHHKLNEIPYGQIANSLKEFENSLYILADHELMNQLVTISIENFDSHLQLYTPYTDRTIESITLIEQIILVIAATELIYNLSVPAPVIINEAVELCKLYGGVDAHKFINNLVDKLSLKLRADEMLNYKNKSHANNR